MKMNFDDLTMDTIKTMIALNDDLSRMFTLNFLGVSLDGKNEVQKDDEDTIELENLEDTLDEDTLDLDALFKDSDEDEDTSSNNATKNDEKTYVGKVEKDSDISSHTQEVFMGEETTAEITEKAKENISSLMYQFGLATGEASKNGKSSFIVKNIDAIDYKIYDSAIELVEERGMSVDVFTAANGLKNARVSW